MPHTTREQFMTTIRQALGRGAPLSQMPAPPAVDESLVRLTDGSADLAALFAERAEAVGMFVRRTTSVGLATQLLDVLRQIDARAITLSVERLAEKTRLREALKQSDIEVRAWQNDRTMHDHYEADAGVTDVHAAIAESGTMVCCSDAQHGRGPSLVPAVHVAIVRRSDIMPDLLDYMARLRGTKPADLPSAQALITGPSKTADIEGILITGVHGPGEVYVLLVEDL